MRVAMLWYGNIGKAAEEAIKAAIDDAGYEYMGLETAP